MRSPKPFIAAFEMVSCDLKHILFQSIHIYRVMTGCLMQLSEVGTMNITTKALRSFQPLKAQHKTRNLIFLISEAQRNFRNKLFDSVEIAEWRFCIKLKRKLTSAIEISQHNANTAFFAILDSK